MAKPQDGQETRNARTLSRRQLGRGALALSGAALLYAEDAGADTESLIARPPQGFSPMTVPGKIVKVSAKGSFEQIMQKNQLWPKPEVAKRLLERSLTEFTGAPNMEEALKRFIHKDDIVAIKPNGIAGQKGHTMAVNFELILPLVESLIKIGVPKKNITVYEQYPTYLMGTRVNVRDWQLPSGIRVGTHNNLDHPMRDIRVYNGIKTRYCRFFTEATAVIDMTQIKDHSICGYTGTMKNITHGNINNPQDHHAHHASPQIAVLYNHPIVTSRVRLHITDAFKIMYDRGPLDKDPRTRIPHGAVYVSTDAVAMDTLGWKTVDDERKARGLPSLKDAGREPRYVQTASELGLGVHRPDSIRLKSVEA